MTTTWEFPGAVGNEEFFYCEKVKQQQAKSCVSAFVGMEAVRTLLKWRSVCFWQSRPRVATSAVLVSDTCSHELQTALFWINW